MITVNVTLAIIFCVLLSKYHNKNSTSNPHARYLAKRVSFLKFFLILCTFKANFIAIWSVCSESFFGLLPYLSLVISLTFRVRLLLVEDTVLMATTSIEGFCTVLVYIKVIVFKKDQIVPSNVTLVGKHHS